MADILGQALLDYFHGNDPEDLVTETNISEEDVVPTSYFFRSFDEMPTLEQHALKLAKGTVLDVGCGAGSHGIWLQEQGLNVTGIDVSEGAIAVSKLRGLRRTHQVPILDFKSGTFDTILLLMNGTGIFGTLEQASIYLLHLKKLLKNGGQILIDSSDLQYMYDATEEGGIWVPADRYYGELEFTMTYKSIASEPFPWLYLDERLFHALAMENGFQFELIAKGDHFDYLARLTFPKDTLL
ncbi:MAG: methyltransferase domain-containing protein [Flavobacteriaceae bacterium]